MPCLAKYPQYYHDDRNNKYENEAANQVIIIFIRRVRICQGQKPEEWKRKKEDGIDSFKTF